MKKGLILIFTTVYITAHAQLPTKNDKVFYEVTDSCHLNKNKLYDRSKLWLDEAFADNKDSLKIDDRQEGELVGKGDFNFSDTNKITHNSNTYKCVFTVKIDMKDAKWRLQIYHILLFFPGIESGIPVEDLASNRSMETGIDVNIHRVISNYKSEINRDDSF